MINHIVHFDLETVENTKYRMFFPSRLFTFAKTNALDKNKFSLIESILHYM